MSCEISVNGLPTLKGSGTIVLSSMRIVFVCAKKVNLGDGMMFESFDFPISLLSKEKFNQPIFGANNLTGVVQPAPDSSLPGEASFKLTFREGGCQTFLDFFLKCLREIRKSSSKNAGTLASLALNGQLEKAGFVDPSDPTVIFVTQPPQQNSKDNL